MEAYLKINHQSLMFIASDYTVINGSSTDSDSNSNWPNKDILNLLNNTLPSLIELPNAFNRRALDFER